MQYVILTYMKHLGVKVKEPRGLEHKRARINFLPKIKVFEFSAVLLMVLQSVWKAAIQVNISKANVCYFNKQKSIKPEKEGEEKVKKPRFPNILGPPRRLSRVDSTSGEKKTTVQPLKLIVLKLFTVY